MTALRPLELMTEAVDRLGVPFGYERSFRLSRGAIHDRRALASLAVESLGPDAPATLIELVRGFGFPEPWPTRSAHSPGSARFFHLGCEESAEGAAVFKAYLEFAVDDSTPPGDGPILVHLAFKWSPTEPGRCVVSRYRWIPNLGLSGILARFGSVLPPGRGRDEATEILLSASRRRPGAPIRLLDVSDEGTCRRSYDINLYDAEAPLGTIASALGRFGARMSIAPGRIERLLAPIRDDALGHLSTGLHRDGEPFLTVYHGVEARGLGSRRTRA